MTLEIKIRPAVFADIDSLISIDHIATQDHKRQMNIRHWVQSGFCYVASQDAKIVAFGVLHHHFFGFGFIEMLMVAPSARRIGIGRSLVRYLAAECETEKLWSSTNQSNLAMQALLVSEGFSQSGIIDNLDPGDPELVFYKMLPK